MYCHDIWKYHYQSISNVLSSCEPIHIQFQPVCYNNTEYVQSELNRHKLPSGGMSSRLGRPNWCDGIQDSGTNTVYDTCCTV